LELAGRIAGRNEAPVQDAGAIRLETQNVPAFQVEDFMPPEKVLKYRVEFVYSEDSSEKDPDKFWKKMDKKWNGYFEDFIGKHKAMEQAVAGIASPSDPPEMKLQKSTRECNRSEIRLGRR